jgi:phosphoadenosine phosphosulfate reductase
LNWLDSDVWKYIKYHNLPYSSLYDQGFKRLGCIICPYHSISQGAGHDLYKQKWPKFFKRWEKFCHLWFEKRQAQGKEMFFDTAEEFIEQWYKGNTQWYKRKEKKTDQISFDDLLKNNKQGENGIKISG